MAQNADLDQLTTSSGTTVKIESSPCTVSSLVGLTQKQIDRIRDQVTARTNEIRELDEKWVQFDGEKGLLVQKIQDVKTSVEQLRPIGSSLDGIEGLLPKIEQLLTEAKRLEKDKESLHKAGKHLTQWWLCKVFPFVINFK